MRGNRHACKRGSRLGLDDYNGPAERLKIVCDHYLDLGLGLREATDGFVVWPCPSCGQASFVAKFDQGIAGCTEKDCGASPSMGLTELMAYLDEDVPEGDARSANAKFSEIFEAAVGGERERETQRRERNRRSADQVRRRKGSAMDAGEERGFSDEQLF